MGRNNKGCGKEFESRTAGIHEIGKSLPYYADESDMCDACEKETWRLSLSTVL